MKDMVLAALAHYPVFSIRDIAAILSKDRNYAHVVAHRLKKRGAIKEVEKGKYSLEPDPFVVASWITWPSYISSWAALSYYKLTEQLPFTIHIITTRKKKRKTILYGGAKIEFIRVKPTTFTGFKRLNYEGKEIFIAEPEKAIIDALTYHKMSIPEAAEIVNQNRDKLDKAKLLQYVKPTQWLAGKLKAVLK